MWRPGAAFLGLVILLNVSSCQDVVMKDYGAVTLVNGEKTIVRKYYPYYPQTCDEYFGYYPHKKRGHILKNEETETTLCETFTDQAWLLNGTIVNASMAEQLLTLIDMETTNFELIYRATRDGFGASDFHSKCDCSKDTLSIIKTTEGTIFGAYTTVRINNVWSWVADSESFLFTLVNPANRPEKLPIRNSARAWLSSSNHLFALGEHDLSLQSDSNINGNSYSYQHQYEGANGLSREASGLYITGGTSNRFRTVEIETYMKKKVIEYSLNSLILNDASLKEGLLDLIGFQSKNFSLLYRATRDGFGASDFHSKCDCNKNLLFIIKTTEGTVFGVYTSVTMNAASTWMRDSEAFLFTLVNPADRPEKLPIKNSQKAYAWLSHPSYFTAFGHHDLNLQSDSNINDNSYSYQVRYEGANGLIREASGLYITGGASNRFRTVEIEVFKVY